MATPTPTSTPSATSSMTAGSTTTGQPTSSATPGRPSCPSPRPPMASSAAEYCWTCPGHAASPGSSRETTLLGSDGNNDTAPSVVPGVGFPVHVLAIAALGVHLIDYLDFSVLAPICAE